MKLKLLAVAWVGLVALHAYDVYRGTPDLRETWEMLATTERQVKAYLCEQEHTTDA